MKLFGVIFGLVLALSSAEFQVEIKNLDNNVYNISCSFAYNSDEYGSSILTYSEPEDWQYVSGNEYNLRFERIDDKHAHVGRCETAFSGAIDGDGLFSAHIYLHSNIASSAGVFSVAIFTEPFSQSTELDLFVANIQDNVLKTGQPNEATSISLSSLQQQWLTVSMKVSGGYCQTNFYNDYGSLVYSTPRMGGCNIGSGPHQIVANARARDSSSYDSSYLTIDSISWEQL